MIQWIFLILALPTIHFLQEEKPLKPSFGILRYIDPFLKTWSNSLVGVTILEKNWLTSSKTKCSNILDHIFGNCLYINNMENDVKLLRKLSRLSVFHIFCYILIRRFLEIISLYLARWLFVGSLFGFVFSSCALTWIYFYKKWKFKKLKKVTKVISKNFLLVLLTFLCSIAVLFSVLVPFCVELVAGGIIDSQLRGIFTNGGISFGKLFRQEKFSTIHDLFYFRSLRKALFDMDRSGIRRYAPVNTEEKLLLQMNLSLINIIASIAFISLYLSAILICCIFTRKFTRYLKTKLPFRIEEYCYKKELKPGIKKPWEELDFSTTIEPTRRNKMKKTKCSKVEKHAHLSRSSLKSKDNEPTSKDKQNYPDSSRSSIVRRRKVSYLSNENQENISRSSMQRIEKKTSTEDRHNNPDFRSSSLAHTRKGSRAVDENQVSISRSSVQRKDDEKKPEKRLHNLDSSRTSILKKMKGSHSTEKNPIEFLKSSRQPKDNVTSIEDKQSYPGSDRGSLRNNEEKDTDCSYMKTSPKKIEIIRPFPKIGYIRRPTIKKSQLNEDYSQTKYVNVGTYACFDTNSSSDDSDFVFADN